MVALVPNPPHTEAHAEFDWAAFGINPTNERTTHLETEYRRMVALCWNAIADLDATPPGQEPIETPETILAVVYSLQSHIPKNLETLHALLQFAPELDALTDRAREWLPITEVI